MSQYTPIRFYYFCGLPHQEIKLFNGMVLYRYKVLTHWKEWKVKKIIEKIKQ